MSSVEHEEMDPAAALRAVRQTQKAVAERIKSPAWFYPLLSVLIGVQIAFIADPQPVVSIVAIVGTAIAGIYYQKATGLWLNGLSTGSRRARLIMAGGIVAMLLSVVLAFWLKREGMPEAVVGLGAAVALFTFWWGSAWEREFRRDAGIEL